MTFKSFLSKIALYDIIGNYENLDKLMNTKGQVGDVASIIETDNYNRTQYAMFIYRYGKWERTLLFEEPSDFENVYGEIVEPVKSTSFPANNSLTPLSTNVCSSLVNLLYFTIITS